MPINCPACLPGYTCEGCWHNNEKQCRYTGMPIPIRDILTHEERLCIAEDTLEVLHEAAPAPSFGALRKSMDHLKGQVLHLENKLNEHMDKPKKERKKIKSEGLDIDQSRSK